MLTAPFDAANGAFELDEDAEFSASSSRRRTPYTQNWTTHTLHTAYPATSSLYPKPNKLHFHTRH